MTTLHERALEPEFEVECIGCKSRRLIVGGQGMPMCEKCFMPMLTTSVTIIPSIRPKAPTHD